MELTNQEIELHRKYLQNIQKKKRYTQVMEEKHKIKISSTKLPFVNGCSLNANANNYNAAAQGPVLFIADKKRMHLATNGA